MFSFDQLFYCCVCPTTILHSKTENPYFSSCSNTGTRTVLDPNLRVLCSPKFLLYITVKVRSLFITVIVFFIFHLTFPFSGSTLHSCWKTFQPFNIPIYSLLIPHTELPGVTSTSAFLLSFSVSTITTFKPILHPLFSL